MPEVEYRRAYPLASLEAAVLNAVGGKPDPDDPESKPLPPERVFTALELLPYYATPTWARDHVRQGIPQSVARDFLARVRSKTLPPWILAICPIDKIRSAA